MTATLPTPQHERSDTLPRVYLDNAAATAIDPRVRAAMEPYWSDVYANTGGLHREGLAARRAVDAARRTVASVLHAEPDEIIFTSGGTEGNNLALMGAYRAAREAGKRADELAAITTAIEHSSVAACFRTLEREGVAVTYLPVDQEGFVDPEALRAACTPATFLVSCILANNEIGTIQPLGALARELRRACGAERRPLLHTDASQAPAWLALKAQALHTDLLTLDAQKLYGPKGVGCLYRKRGVALAPIFYGGGQETGLRPGTPPTPLLVGFAEALRIVEEERETYCAHVAELRDRFLSRVLAALPAAAVNGPRGAACLPNIANVSVLGLDAEQVVIELDARGIAASTRSACLLDEAPGSTVVAALGKGPEYGRSAVRFSLARTTSEEEVDRAAAAFIEVVRWLGREK